MIKKIEKDYDNSRLDRWLLKNKLVNSAVEAQKFIRTGKVKVNGKKVKINARVCFNDEVCCPEVEVIKSKKKKYEPNERDRKLLIESVLYRDDNVIVINKPEGLAVQGGSGSFKNLDSMLEVLRFGNKENPKLVHRLDKKTSGVLILARNNKTAHKMLEGFKQKTIKKVYVAWGWGSTSKKEGVINYPLMKKLGNNERVVVSVNGKEAVTRYKVLDKYENKATLFELYPETGRMHQIRVHLQKIGCPIIGDGKYGGKKVYLKEFKDRMYLHAKKITFPNPSNEEKMISVEAPLPDCFSR
ncbi:MAG: RluA family pseudouridine synthase [Alphaproteobacteria bacterium]|nr:RluA family pseudouridine synthase [Alphaproteobacteria bacterium]